LLVLVVGVCHAFSTQLITPTHNTHTRTQDLLVFPITAFYGKWTYPQGQLEFLREALLSFPDAFTQKSPISVPDGIGGSTTLGTEDPWNNMELLQTLVDIAGDGTHVDAVLDILKIGAKQVPELVLLGLASMPPTTNSLHPVLKEFCVSLGMSFLSGVLGNASFVIPRLWTMSPQLMLAVLVSTYNADRSSLPRLLDIAIEIKAIHRVLEVMPTPPSVPFLVDLAILSGRREYCNLEKWASDRVSGGPADPTFMAILEYMATRPPTMDHESLMTFLRAYKPHEPRMAPDHVQVLALLFKEASNAAAAAAASSAAPTASPFSPQVEEESNAFYEKLYKGEIQVGGLIATLQAYSESSSPLEQDVCKCIISNLFEEIKFFARYPEKELMLTAILFGSLIQYNLLPPKLLGVALKYVFESCSNPTNSKLFKFGVVALELFKGRLGEWPQFNTLLASIPHLVPYLNSAEGQATVASLGALAMGASAPGPAGTTSAGAAAAAGGPVALFTSPFTPAKHDALPAELQEKLSFHLNNISGDSLSSKLPMLVELVPPPFYAWFSSYLLRKRVCLEPNHHPVYLSMLQGFPESKALFHTVFVEALAFVERLLNAEKTLSSSSERSLLKNLGVWLGWITLGRNVPIKHTHLSLKVCTVRCLLGWLSIPCVSIKLTP
jgi:CCR4-NOT transcription complex subunit 1